MQMGGGNQGGRPGQGSHTASCRQSPHRSLLSLVPALPSVMGLDSTLLSTPHSHPARQLVMQVAPSE